MQKNTDSDPKNKKVILEDESVPPTSGKTWFQSEEVVLHDMRAVPMAAPESRLGERVRYARNALNLNIEALSRLTKEDDPQGNGLSPTSIARYESGDSLPGIREFRILCEALEIPLAWLLYGDTTDDTNGPKLTEGENIVLAGLRAMMIENKQTDAFTVHLTKFEMDRFKAETRTARLAKARKP